MNNDQLEYLKSLEEQYETTPYPHIPINKSHQEGNNNSLFIHDLTTPYYLLTQKKINSEKKFILDAGCGSGWTSLALAQANPQAQIICIDLFK